MMEAQPLPSRILSYWDTDQEVFVLHRHNIKLTLEDIYFLNRLPPLGVVVDIYPMSPHGRNITEFVELHYPRDLCVKDMTISVGDLERLDTWVVSAVVLRIFGSQELHHITSG